MQYTTYLRWGVISGLFLMLFVPFVAPGAAAGIELFGNIFFPYITGKNFAFRILIEIVFLLYILLALREPKYRPRASTLMWVTLAFVAWMGIATIFSVDPAKSFWSNFERMDGYISLIHYFMLFMVVGAMLSVSGLWKRFMQTSVAVSTLMGLYGFFQILGWLEISSQSGSRVDTTFGNALYTGVYMLFNIFLTLFLLVREGKSRGMQAAYGIALALQVTTLLYTQSRGPALGLIGGLILTALYIAIFSRGKEWKLLRKASWAGLAVIMLLVGGVFTVRDTQFVQNMPAVSRIANVSLEEATVQSRLLYIWPIALGGAMEKPVTGWGQENFSYIFNEHYPSQMYNQEQWFDRAHNQFLDWLVAGGVPAFLLYVLLFFLMVWIILRSDKLLVPEKGILLGLLAAYAFNNSFVFDNLMSAVYFYILLAYVHGLSAEPLPRRIFLSKPISDHGIAIAAPIVAVVILAGMWMFNAQGIARARTIIDAISSVDRKTGEEQTPKERLEYFRRTLEQGRLGQQEVVEQLYQYSSGLGGSSLAPEVKEEAYALAKSAGEEMLAVRPSDARLESFTGIFHAQYGEYGEALEHLERADELSPNKQSILFQLGEVQLRSGNTEEAIATYKRAFELVPEFDTARMMYAAALYYAGRITEADQLLEDRFGATIFDNDQLVQIYSSMGLEDRVVEIWKLRVEKDPENTDTYLGLASAYFAVGDVSSTIATLRKVAQINPATAAQVEQLISQIQSGALQVQQ